MALKALGTNANNSLSALLMSGAMAVADIAAYQQAVLDDQNALHPVAPGAFQQNGLLFVPNRGVLRVLPGDVVAVDAITGWPILVSARAIAAGPYAFA